MNIEELKPLLDLGGVFILAFIFIRQLAQRFDYLDYKLSKILALLVLAVEEKVDKNKLEQIISENGKEKTK